jgi:hypothetical protein
MSTPDLHPMRTMLEGLSDVSLSPVVIRDMREVR